MLTDRLGQQVVLNCHQSVHICDDLVQGSFAFGAANGLLRKMVPSLERFQTTVLDLTDTDAMDDTAALVRFSIFRCSAPGSKLCIATHSARQLCNVEAHVIHITSAAVH